MTTFQDPPPQSRRAVRQSERGETPATTDAVTPDAAAFDGSAFSTPTPSTPVAPPAPAAPQSGRRAQQRATPPAAEAPQTPFTPPVSAGEPLTYATQNRVGPPPTEQFIQEPLAAQPPPIPAQQPVAQPQGEFRVRDFSPEGGRRSAINREQQAAPAFAAPVDLDYHTQGAIPGATPLAPAEQQIEDTINHTLSRRELREMRAAEQDSAPALRLPEAIDTLLNSGPIDIPTLAPPPGQSQALAEAMAEFDLLTRSRREAEARARDAQVASLQAQPAGYAQPVGQPEPVAQQQPVAQPHPVAQVVAEPFAQQQPPQLVEPQSSVPSAPFPTYPAPGSAPQAPAVQGQYPPVSAPYSQPVPPVQAPPVQQPMAQAEADPVFIEPQLPTSRSSGHWSAQVDAEDDELPFENTLSRTVGSNTSAITTSALVLPSVPQPSGILGSVGNTGEILITGSIDLPRSLASTGAHPSRVDNSDFEDDPLDSQVSSPDSAPVRAIRAVSTHTSTRGVIESKVPQSNRLLMVGIIAASVLGLGVVGFLIFAFASNQL